MAAAREFINRPSIVNASISVINLTIIINILSTGIGGRRAVVLMGFEKNPRHLLQDHRLSK